MVYAPGGTFEKLNSPFAVTDVVRLSLLLPDGITSLVAIRWTLMYSGDTPGGVITLPRMVAVGTY